MSAVTVIVPTWNRRDLLERLLGRLRAQTQAAAEILVVDNGSGDGSPELAEQAGARVIRLGSNEGFARAVNRGIQESRTPLVAIVNNDIEPAQDWLDRLVRVVRRPGVWFATGKILSAAQPDSIDGAFDLLSRGACAWRAGSGRKDGPAWNKARTIQFPPLTAALFRAELFQKLGLLDERFESYLEDVEFGLRCALEGYQGIYVPEAEASHVGSATLGVWHKDTVRRMARNQIFLVKKHFPGKCVVRHAWSILAGQLLWGVLAARHGAGLAWAQGKLEGIGRTLPDTKPAEPELLTSILQESEREILRLQESTGYDLYWRLYFALT